MANNRAQSWPRDCPYCGRCYRLTNLMVRTVDGIKTDTHLIGCKRRQQGEGGRCVVGHKGKDRFIRLIGDVADRALLARTPAEPQDSHNP
jgi:hypothetical protein